LPFWTHPPPSLPDPLSMPEPPSMPELPSMPDPPSPPVGQQGDPGMAGKPQLSMQRPRQAPLGTQHVSSVLHSSLGGHEQPTVMPQAVTEVLQLLPQAPAGLQQEFWKQTSVPLHSEGVHATMPPHPFEAEPPHWLPHAALSLSGVQHELW
jgi:hypothetical protein